MGPLPSHQQWFSRPIGWPPPVTTASPRHHAFTGLADSVSRSYKPPKALDFNNADHLMLWVPCCVGFFGFSVRGHSLSTPRKWTLFGPCTTLKENGSSLLSDVMSAFHSPTKQTSKQWMIGKSIHFFFLLSSHSLWAMIVKKGYSVFTLVVTSKNNPRIRHSVKEKSYLSLFVLSRALMKPWDDVTK